MFSRICITWLIIFFLPMLGAHSKESNQAQKNLSRISLSAGIHQFNVQVAQTEEQHSIGLMYAKSMPKNEGMLFVFSGSQSWCFWMKNTLFPISAAFLDDNGIIINIEIMAPQTLDEHCSKKPVRFVIEMNKGWFSQRGLKPGSKISGRPFSP